MAGAGRTERGAAKQSEGGKGTRLLQREQHERGPRTRGCDGARGQASRERDRAGWVAPLNTPVISQQQRATLEANNMVRITRRCGQL